MAVKKDMTRRGIVRQRKRLERMADLKRRRMADIMAGAMDDKAAWLLADLTDAEVRRVAHVRARGWMRGPSESGEGSPPRDGEGRRQGSGRRGIAVKIYINIRSKK